MNRGRIIIYSLGIVFGGLMVWYGQIDDSPGAGLIGFLAAALGIFGTVKTLKKKEE